jgi:hypothetical protein
MTRQGPDRAAFTFKTPANIVAQAGCGEDLNCDRPVERDLTAAIDGPEAPLANRDEAFVAIYAEIIWAPGLVW